jgi:hypothetical protein
MPNVALFSRISFLSLSCAVSSLCTQSVVSTISSIHAPGMGADPLRTKNLRRRNIWRNRRHQTSCLLVRLSEGRTLLP